MKSLFTRFTLKVLVCLLLTLSCSKDDSSEVIPFSFDPIDDIANYQGNIDSEVIVVYVQGGPDLILDDADVDEIISNTGTQNILTINVHQSQTLDPLGVANEDITFEEAIQLDQESVDNLQRVIGHLKRSGKTVYVLGSSFGGFLVQEFIADYGIDQADAYLILASRLDIQEGFWMAFSEGNTGGFENGGTDWFLFPQGDPLSRNISRLAAGVGMNRYTERFANIPSLEKVSYSYGTADERVGTLTNSEIQFLTSKGAKLITVAGDHNNAIVEGLLQGYDEGFNLGN